ncbi:MAG TPA: DUF2189 domain-containing protein [Steroidobacteraceae bacterium]|nr:DUF2189 domain-containing protein [Steroidobacteraceae bacterium]
MAISLHWGRQSHVQVHVRTVEAARPLRWLEQGWQDLRAHWRVSLAHGLLLTAAGWVLLALGSTHPYLIAAAITGFLLVGPLMTTGVVEVSRRARAGQAVSFDESLEGFTRSRPALFEFSLIIGAIAVLWFIVSEVLLRWMFDTEAPTLGRVLNDGVLQAASGLRILAYVVIGGGLAALVFVVSAVSVPLIIDRHASAGQAMRTSLRAVFANLPAMLVWSAVLVVLTAIGFATLLIGMIWIAPLLGHATWHAYRDLIE